MASLQQSSTAAAARAGASSVRSPPPSAQLPPVLTASRLLSSCSRCHRAAADRWCDCGIQPIEGWCSSQTAGASAHGGRREGWGGSKHVRLAHATLAGPCGAWPPPAWIRGPLQPPKRRPRAAPHPCSPSSPNARTLTLGRRQRRRLQQVLVVDQRRIGIGGARREPLLHHLQVLHREVGRRRRRWRHHDRWRERRCCCRRRRWHGGAACCGCGARGAYI